MHRLKNWENAIGLELDAIYYTHLCCAHFDDTNFDEAYLLKRQNFPQIDARPKLRANAVPHLNIPRAGIY